MLDLWKTMMQLQPAHYGCTIERTDGIDIDELLLIHIRKWYASLLLSAPDGIVPVEDVKDRLSVMVADNGVVTAMVPPECVCPVEWKLKAWQKSVTLFCSQMYPKPPICTTSGHALAFATLPPLTMATAFYCSRSPTVNSPSSTWHAAWCAPPMANTSSTRRFWRVYESTGQQVNESMGQRGNLSMIRNLDDSKSR